MNTPNWKLIAICAFGLAALSSLCFWQEEFERRPDGVVLRLKNLAAGDARLLKVQVCADNIIRIVASLGEVFSARPSLMVSQTQWKPVPFSARLGC
jgi:hypothetical protein